MNTSELLERRASRGTPRGAAAVWRDAHEPFVDAKPDRRPSGLFRVALAAWVAALAVAGVVVMSQDGRSAVSDGHTEEATAPSADRLPAPVLVEGGVLARDRGGVSRPTDPRYDADDLFDDVTQHTFPDTSEVTTSVIFAREDDGLGGPVVGIELLPGGGFRPWGANLDAGELDGYTAQLRRVDDRWTMPAASGLVEVANLVDDFASRLELRWQFDFELGGDDRVTLQAEVGTPDRPVSEWLWVSRLAKGVEATDLTLTPIEVLGHDGIVIETANDQGNEVVWSDGEFVYRLLSSTDDGDTSLGRDATDDVTRLRVAERAEWIEAIRASTRETGPEQLARIALLPLLGLAAVSAVLFAVRRSLLAVVVAVLAALTLVLGTATEPTTVVLALAGLALAWWRFASTTRVSHSRPEPDTQPNPEPTI
jgi:hypothetical protein